MRVITGTARGIQLKTPDGLQTRPTADRVKEALFSIINFDIPEENEYYVHRIGRTGRAKRKGVAWSIIGNFPEKAKLDEICKFCKFTVQPMILGDDGTLTAEEVKPTPPPQKRRRYR